MDMNIQLFDIEAYLEDRGIRIHHSGKNVSPGWIGLNCFWCDDPSNHLGINLRSKIFKCWACGRKGPPQVIVKHIDQVGEEEAKNIIEKFLDPLLIARGREEKKTANEVVFPKEIGGSFTDIYYKYLNDRGLSINYLKFKYQIKCGGTSGRFKYRVIIPIIMNEITVGFTGRDVSDRNPVRYKNCKIEESSVHPSKWIYNIDTVRNSAIIVEGPIDVWKMGDGVICLLGTEFSMGQINILLEKKIGKLYVLFDSTEVATKRALSLAKELSLFIPSEIIEVDIEDPGKLSMEEGKELKTNILKGG